MTHSGLSSCEGQSKGHSRANYDKTAGSNRLTLLYLLSSPSLSHLNQASVTGQAGNEQPDESAAAVPLPLRPPAGLPLPGRQSIRPGTAAQQCLRQYPL